MPVLERHHVDVRRAQHDHIGALAGHQRSGLVGDAHGLGAVDGGHLQALRLREPQTIDRRVRRPARRCGTQAASARTSRSG